MQDEDPITQFFFDQESVDLYEVLTVPQDAKMENIRKTYRRLALLYHPDKHATASAAAKAEASTKFQQIGFAYAVLGDEKRRRRYDTTGKTDQGFDLAAGEGGWEAYFEDMFERVTRGKLDEMKKEYQGSADEIEDLKTAYINTNGALGDIMNHVPHSTYEDEARIIFILSQLISEGALPTFDAWEASTKDEKAMLDRKNQGEKEAQEAEKLARELGVWNEFYGSGKEGERRGKGVGKQAKKADEEDHSTLQALILKKKQKDMDGFFDGLAAKYAEPENKGKGKKRRQMADIELEGASPAKKSQKGVMQMPDIDDEEFQRLQNKLFGDKAKAPEPRNQAGKSRRKVK